MTRIFNFSAGPATLPQEVLEIAQKELQDYKGTGMSVMELSHRSAIYQEVINTAEADLRKLMNIPENYSILFMQGGASSQFSMVPLNLMNKHKKALFINTGVWSKKAIAEAKRYGDVDVIASSEKEKFTCIPDFKNLSIDKNVDYLHITSNNTIYGTKFSTLPNAGNIPIVSDMSSFILSETINVKDYGLIYAGAQKNIGSAGVTIVIIKNDLMGKQLNLTPKLYNYKEVADAGSMLNTPPTYAIYIAGLVFKWLIEKGGVQAIEIANKEKAALLYNFIDNSTFYKSPIDPNDRSLMNVPFITPNENFDKAFISESAKQGLANLKGHRSVGGMRASIYNAMPFEGVKKLVDFMKKFARRSS